MTMTGAEITFHNEKRGRMLYILPQNQSGLSIIDGAGLDIQITHNDNLIEEKSISFSNSTYSIGINETITLNIS